LRVRARPRDRTNVNNKLDFHFEQQINEFSNRTSGVADGEKWMRHV